MDNNEFYPSEYGNEGLLTPEITGLLSSIHEFRGKQDLYIAAKRDVLKTLLDVALMP